VFQQNYHDCTEQEIYTEYLPNTYVCAIVLFFISRFLAKLAEEANSSASNQGQIVYLVCPNSAKFWQENESPPQIPRWIQSIRPKDFLLFSTLLCTRIRAFGYCLILSFRGQIMSFMVRALNCIFKFDSPCLFSVHRWAAGGVLLIQRRGDEFSRH